MDTVRLSRKAIYDSAAALIALVGDEWLARKLAVPRDADVHKLAQWMYQAKRELPQAQSTGNISQTMLRLAWLMQHIEALRKASVAGTETRLGRLTSGTEEQFWAVLSELRTAHRYLLDKHRVEFIPETDKPTPDLLIDGSIEIECKQRARVSKQDRLRRALYRLLYRRVRAVVNADPSSDGLEVEIHFFPEPSRELVDEVAGRAKSFFGDHRRYSEWSSNQAIDLRLIRLFPTVFRNWDTYIAAMNDLPPDYDDVQFHTRGAKLNSGEVSADKISSFACKCYVEEDAVKGLRSSLNSAADQFSGTRPTIVHLDVTSIVPKLRSRDRQRARAVILEVFRNRRSISAVRLIQDHVGRDDSGWLIGQSIQTIRNPNARHPLMNETSL